MPMQHARHSLQLSQLALRAAGAKEKTLVHSPQKEFYLKTLLKPQIRLTQRQ